MGKPTVDHDEPWVEAHDEGQPRDLDIQSNPRLVLRPEMHRSGVVRLANLTDSERVRLAAQRYVETLPRLARDILQDIATEHNMGANAWITSLVAAEIDKWGHGQWFK